MNIEVEMGSRKSVCVSALVMSIGLIPLLFAEPTTTPATMPSGLPDGPTWGRGRFQPKGANVLFASADGCALCHSASPNATALWSNTGDDVSPHGLWQGTMMAHAAKDPYFRAQLSKEKANNPGHISAIEGLCMRCHTPMAHQTQKIANQPPLSFAEAASHPLYSDGVSCTVCHQIQPDGLGTEATFDGQPTIKTGRKIFGPYADPGGTPMQVHSAFTPMQGSHIQSSALCASCHTLRTEHTPGAKFPEQSPYFEWRNSQFSDEEAPNGQGRTLHSQSCQECHMPDLGAMRIARNPAGFDFNIKTREQVRGHAFVGGNAFMLELLRDNAKELGVTAPPEALTRIAQASRAMLGHRTATIAVENARREDNADGTKSLVFEVLVTNLTGHKFPTGYPSRRAWISTSVRSGNSVLFSSGEVDEKGAIRNVEPASEIGVPHVDLVTKNTQVPIYEMTAADTHGTPTVSLVAMAARIKDNRLLPAGFRMDGPHAADTSPVGINGDTNFVGGSDRVTYRIPIPADATGRVTIVTRLLYQTIPPAWAGALRDVKTPESELFTRIYDAAKAKPEQIAVTVGSLE